ncbi:MAG: hypothetical protein OEX18_01055 [Candidatus Krumholzibacteria bacterium]|nr:hypothetical protein [Candidatus Krumholzibacteria bacterium]MDH4335853.1 hypothetical protein [Candidatus Krumholzibacteria bacterium]MDH5270345.1 hypothetical protein [Candidatus Krumholzibacteria bacterium]MDH5626745.1 hypothetical protein [Candidatus Krumholzibacteria bacterium]
MKTTLATIALALSIAAPIHAQPASPDLTSAEGVVRELYRLVCVEPGQTTDWDQVRALFIPQAVIVLRVSRDASDTFTLEGWIDDFVAFNEKARVSERGFTEKIVRMDTTVFRDIASIYVLYEAAITDSERPPTVGVDIVNLIQKDGRWWIASIVNDLPNADNPIPQQLAE